jgi:hypothetical protein
MQKILRFSVPVLASVAALVATAPIALATPAPATITVTAPATSATVSATTTISWTNTGSWSGNKVNIYYSINNFTSTTTLATNLNVNTGTPYSWDTTAQSNTATAKIRVVAASDSTILGSTGSFTINNLTAQNITVNTHAPATAVYGSTFPVAATASSALTVAITATGSCSISSGTVTMTSGTGTCTVHYNQTGNGTYAAATEVTESTTAQKKALTAVITPSGKVYDATTAASAICGLTGLVAPDNVTCSPTSTTFADANVGAGKTVTATGISLSGTPSGNYTVNSSATGTASITARPITVTPDSSQAKIYGQSDPSLTKHVTSGSLAGSDTLTGALTRDSGEDVGTYAITQGTLTAGSNYNLTFTSGVNFAITPATATVTIDAVTLNPDYDTNAHVVTATTNPGGLSYDITYTGSSVNYGPSTSAPTVAGTYTISANITDPNYTGTDSNTLTIHKVNPVIVVTPYSVAFDGSAHTATGSVTGVGSGGALTGLDLSATEHTAIGSYGTDAWVFTDTTGNYNDAQGTVADEITNAIVTHTLTYGQNDHGTVSGTLTQVVNDGTDGTGVTATADTGYHFLGWTDGAGSDNPRIDKNVTQDITVAPIFLADPGTNPNGNTNNGSIIAGIPSPLGQVLGVSTTNPAGEVLGASTFVFAKNLRYRMHDADVIELQKLLISLGFPIPDSVTTYFGSQTVAAVKAYQKSKGLPQTGFVGPLTRAALNAGS